MKMKLSQIIVALLMTVGLLVGLEIVTATLLPLFNWYDYRLTFHVLIIIFLAIRLDTPLTPWMILVLQLIHSAFSVEGWAIGTFAGIIILLSANYLKEVLHLTTALMTMITVQLFQIIWFVTVTTIICLKISDFSKFGMVLWSFVPGSFILSFIAPFLFWFLEKIWRGSSESSHGVGI
ncbi:MAG TPA: hypothetical protein VKZ84_02605 [Bacteriovoracaceae bacterium]|nr:hypothetical protein [Bacteriovoracaceae bacterium]